MNKLIIGMDEGLGNGEDIKKFMEDIREKYSKLLDSTSGQTVIKTLRPSGSCVPRACLLLENRVIVEIGTPFNPKIMRRATKKECENACDQHFIYAGCDIYDVKELKERLQTESELEVITYYREILDSYGCTNE